MASAADLPVKAPAVAVTPAYNWTGFYVGANFGYGWGTLSSENGSTTYNIPGFGIVVASNRSDSENPTGIIGGGQIGYNWQIDKLVLGLEADLDGSGQTVSNSVTIANCTFAAGSCTVSGTVKIDWFATVRGRVGFAADRWLFYATAGYGWQHGKTSSTVTVGATSGSGGETAETRGSYVVGGGVETALSANWIAGVEYLYLDTGTFSTSRSISAAELALFGAPAGTTAVSRSDNRLTNNIVRLRLGYRF